MNHALLEDSCLHHLLINRWHFTCKHDLTHLICPPRSAAHCWKPLGLPVSCAQIWLHIAYSTSFSLHSLALIGTLDQATVHTECPHIMQFYSYLFHHYPQDLWLVLGREWGRLREEFAYYSCACCLFSFPNIRSHCLNCMQYGKLAYIISSWSTILVGNVNHFLFHSKTKECKKINFSLAIFLVCIRCSMPSCPLKAACFHSRIKTCIFYWMDSSLPSLSSFVYLISFFLPTVWWHDFNDIQTSFQVLCIM